MRPPQALIIALKRRRPRGVSHAWGSHVVHAVLQRAATGWGASARPRTRMPSRREAQPQRRGAARGCDGRVLCGSCALTCARAAAGARRTESEAFKDDLRCSALVGRRTASGRSPPAYFGTRVPCFYNQMFQSDSAVSSPLSRVTSSDGLAGGGAQGIRRDRADVLHTLGIRVKPSGYPASANCRFTRGAKRVVLGIYSQLW